MHTHTQIHTHTHAVNHAQPRKPETEPADTVPYASFTITEIHTYAQSYTRMHTHAQTHLCRLSCTHMHTHAQAHTPL